jgi:hypothetical protein
VLLEHLLGGLSELEANEGEAALLETSDNLANEATLDAVGPAISFGSQGRKGACRCLRT